MGKFFVESAVYEILKVSVKFDLEKFIVKVSFLRSVQDLPFYTEIAFNLLLLPSNLPVSFTGLI